MPRTIIHTLDGRDNVMLEVMRDYFRLSPIQMNREIVGAVKRTAAVLKSKGVDYASLKTALVPQSDKHEIALFFDSTEVGDSWYSQPIHTRLLPLLHKGSSRSILEGDYIGRRQDVLFELFDQQVRLVRDVEWRWSNQFYIVYINNLTDGMMAAILDGLADFRPFVGFADMTYASRLKAALSTMLVRSYIQHRKVIISQHEDDRPDSEDINMPGYPFEAFGFRVRSIPGDLFGLFLSYKIERPVFPGFEVDTEFSLNAVSTQPMALADFDIVLDEAKLAYLEANKSESLRQIGMLGAGASELKALIRAKIASNYLYSMTYTDEHDTTQFNVVLEAARPSGEQFRVTVGLEYIPLDKQLRVITLF